MLKIVIGYVLLLTATAHAQTYRLGNEHCETNLGCSDSSFEQPICDEIEKMLIAKNYKIVSTVKDERFSVTFSISSEDEAGNWFTPYYAHASIFDSKTYSFLKNEKVYVGYFESGEEQLLALAKSYIRNNIQSCTLD